MVIKQYQWTTKKIFISFFDIYFVFLLFYTHLKIYDQKSFVIKIFETPFAGVMQTSQLMNGDLG